MMMHGLANVKQLDSQGYIFYFYESQIKIYYFHYYYHRATIKCTETHAADCIIVLQESVFSVTMFSIRLSGVKEL
jgi:hypothetical protein